MIAKKHFAAVIVLLVFLGFYTKQQPVPNQEISVQFVDKAFVDISGNDVVEIITTQLQSLGVTDIQVRQQDNGTLKISYYSDEAVADIKKVLTSIGIHAEKGADQLPIDKKLISFEDVGTVDSFKLDVYELQTATNQVGGIHGKYIVSLQRDYDKAPTPNSFGNTRIWYTSYHKTAISFVAVQSNYTAIITETVSCKIPDVRAGPIGI